MAAAISPRSGHPDRGAMTENVGAPDPKIDPDVLETGADCLAEFVNPGGLTNSSYFVAAEVYRAMERRRLEKLSSERAQ